LERDEAQAEARRNRLQVDPRDDEGEAQADFDLAASDGSAGDGSDGGARAPPAKKKPAPRRRGRTLQRADAGSRRTSSSSSSSGSRSSSEGERAQPPAGSAQGALLAGDRHRRGAEDDSGSEGTGKAPATKRKKVNNALVKRKVRSWAVSNLSLFLILINQKLNNIL
jgi:hypothetical protein